MTSRRGFLGLFGGAVAAGPKLAAGIADTVAQNSGMPMPSMGYGGATSGLIPSSDWRSDRIAQIKKFLKGGGKEEAEARYRHRLGMADQIERFRLDSLRSVSSSYKMTMFSEGQFERSQRIERLYMKRELSDLLKQVPFA